MHRDIHHTGRQCIADFGYEFYIWYSLSTVSQNIMTYGMYFVELRGINNYLFCCHQGLCHTCGNLFCLERLSPLCPYRIFGAMDVYIPLDLGASFFFYKNDVTPIISMVPFLKRIVIHDKFIYIYIYIYTTGAKNQFITEQSYSVNNA